MSANKAATGLVLSTLPVNSFDSNRDPITADLQSGIANRDRFSSSPPGQAAKMDETHKIQPIPNFDEYFRNFTYDEALRIYDTPKLKRLMDSIQYKSSQEAHPVAFLEIGNQIGQQVGSSYIFQEFTRRTKIGMEEKKKDLCIIPKDLAKGYRTRDWLIVGDPNYSLDYPERQNKKFSEFRIELSILPLYARTAMYKQNFRHCLLGFTMRRTKMRMFAFTVNGACSSDEFDVTVNPARFVRILASCLTMTREQLGYDPNAVAHSNGTGTVWTAGGNEVYRLESYVSRTDEIYGLSTSIWKARKTSGAVTEAPMQLGDAVIIKDAWQIDSWKQEGDMSKQALVSEVPLFSPGMNPVLQSSHHIADWPTPLWPSTYIHHEAVKHNFGPMNCFLGKRALWPGCAVREATAESAEHRRLVFESKQCVKIEDLTSHLDLFTAIRDCVDRHWALYRAGVLHRNISKDNLMVAFKETTTETQTPAEKRKKISSEQPQPSMQGQTLATVFGYGFIIDFNLATNADASTRFACGAPFATGNKLFMAREVLAWLHKTQGRADGKSQNRPMTRHDLEDSMFKQEYRHDIESFYWVLLWCLFRMDRSGERNMRDTFGEWAVGSYNRVESGKGYLLHKLCTGIASFSFCGPSELTAKAFSAQLVSFSMILADLDYLKNLEPVELYCRFQRGLTEMIDFLKKV